MSGDALSGGFADPVFDAQATFRAVLDALSRPGRIVALGQRVAPPAPLLPAAAAVIAALADDGTPVFLDPALDTEPVRGWIAFHTGAPVTRDPAAAAFAVVGNPSEMLAFSAFAQGTAEYPDRAATLILQVAALDGGTPLVLSGPGIATAATLAPRPLPPDFAGRMRANRALFPLGLDVVLAAPEALAGLPRSVRIEEGG